MIDPLAAGTTHSCPFVRAWQCAGWTQTLLLSYVNERNEVERRLLPEGKGNGSKSGLESKNTGIVKLPPRLLMN